MSDLLTKPSITLSDSIAISQQAAHSVVMVRPHHFTPNPQTADDNHFQQKINSNNHQAIAQQAYKQVTHAAEQLINAGLNVFLFEDSGTATPDSVFPNNWFSTHHNGNICLYPMYCQNRRKEIRHDIIETLYSQYRVNQLIDYRKVADEHQFLEGTGAMVLDHQNRIAYAARSHRMNEALFEKFCRDNEYLPVCFDATDHHNLPIYHTNVLMSVTPNFVIIALNCIKSIQQRKHLVSTIKNSGKQLVIISEQQMNQFAGNVLCLQNSDNKPILAMSGSAFNAFTHIQLQQLTEKMEILSFDVSALELAGGSIRCMMADIHLPPNY